MASPNPPAPPRGGGGGGGNFLTQHSIPGIDLPNWVVIVGVVAAVGIAWYIRNRVSGGQSTSAGATSTTGSGLPSQIDPVTGVPYSIEGAINPQTGVPFYYTQGQGQTGIGYTIGSNFGGGTLNQTGAGITPPDCGPGTMAQWAINQQAWVCTPIPGFFPPEKVFFPPEKVTGTLSGAGWDAPRTSPSTPATGTLPPVKTGTGINYTPVAPPPFPLIQTRRI